MPIDTDDLSARTYRAIMIEAERFNHVLTLKFGLLSYRCKDEKDFIRKSKKLIDEMKSFDKADMDDKFFGNRPDRKDFLKALDKILANIKQNEISDVSQVDPNSAY